VFIYFNFYTLHYIHLKQQ